MRRATVSDVLARLLRDRDEQAKAGQRSLYTVSFYKRTSGHRIRLLEHDAQGNYLPFRLVDLTAPVVDELISQRRTEGASEAARGPPA